ncbi:MAG: HD domain-containing protein [Hyphomonadaceae bacterium]|nr:HD domain-containing protein [Clostridia bacterium]
MERLQKQLDFLKEIDKVKSIFRHNLLMDSSRHENDAEHSWHLAVMAMVLYEHGEAAEYNLLHVIKMVLIHDLVEIDAGDTFCYDEVGNLDKEAREQLAANRIFGLLPQDQATEMQALWHEFELKQTPEAKFAAALDRVAPVLWNLNVQATTWDKFNVPYEKVIARNQPIEQFSPKVWAYVKMRIDKWYLKKEDSPCHT